ncbi:MAG: hemolysin family protein [Syntrophothermus sp.]
MDIAWHSKLIALIILFLLYAFISSSEVALFSLDKRLFKTQLNNNPLICRYLTYLLDFPRRLLVTILISSTLVSVTVSIIAVSITIDISNEFNLNTNLLLTIQIIILTILVVLFGELIPKVLGSREPIKVAKYSAIPFYWINVIFYPIAETLTELIKLSVSKMKLNKTKSAILPEELSELADLSHERGTIIEEEHGLINSIVSFRSVAVHEIMTPRVDMISISKDSDFDDLVQVITSTGHSRIPLYDDDLDEIIGIIYAKDVLPYIQDEKKKKELSLEKLKRNAMFIPRTKMINDLMLEFQEKKMHIAIVVDEYGGTEGLITLEDIIEEIIGEIRDEYDKEEPSFIKLTDNSYMVKGKLSVDELNDLLETKIDIEDNDFETLGGLIFSTAGSIPKEGYSFILQNHKFTVKEILKKRIEKVLIEKLPSENNA